MTALIIVMLAGHVALGQSPATRAPAKPLGEQELIALLAVGLDDQTLINRINLGVNFDASAEAVDRLAKEGASEAVVKAVQEAAKKRSTSAPAAPGSSAVTYQQVLLLVSTGIDEQAILDRLAKSPTRFVISPDQIAELKKAGATDKLIAAMQGERPASPQAKDITDLAIILDCSGSMRETTAEGQSKMAVAQKVVTDLIQRIPNGINLTFIIYGHEVYGGADDPRNCQAVKVARPLSPLNDAGKSELTALIGSLRATGATPIALSLRTAGEELKKNDALCGLVLVTDGLESCKGDPAAEAAALAANLKITFGVNVVGFGVKPDENAALKAIADAGRGAYYSAANAKELAEKMLVVAEEIAEVAKKPETVDTSRRAIRVLQPKIEMPAMGSIYLVAEEEAERAVFTKIGSVTKYGDYLRIPSSTNKYAVVWAPKEGRPVFLKRNFSLPERQVVDLQPESVLGLIQVDGTDKVNEIYVLPAGDRSAVATKIQQAKKYGDIMVVAAGKYDVYVSNSSVGNSLIEEGLEVAPGKLHRLQ